jgi:hypothetical protein
MRTVENLAIRDAADRCIAAPAVKDLRYTILVEDHKQIFS